ncbi:MAG: hypothetical protein L0Y71_21735, partial [Gemmataceae bacterium]|nr:hypothetical protein [Gemmataceae bacterium]
MNVGRTPILSDRFRQAGQNRSSIPHATRRIANACRGRYALIHVRGDQQFETRGHFFAAAVEIGGDAERRAYVEQACAGDADLKRRVEEM